MMFGDSHPIQKEANRVAMSPEWDGFPFKDLHASIENNVAYAVFANVPLTNAQTVNTLRVVTFYTISYAA